MLTERKALATMFEDLQEEKRQLKANYRNDMAAIEHRQEQILNRLQRLDDLEREAVDVEGTLTQLAATTKQLAELIPAVPVATIIDKVTEEAAAAGVRIETPQETPQDAPALDLSKMPGIKQPNRAPDIIEAVEAILKEVGKPLNARELEQIIKDKHGWEWGNFTGVFSNWRTKYPNNIKKMGRVYTVEGPAVTFEGKELQQHGYAHTEQEETTV